MYQKFGKRFLDILLSACGILVLSPVYLLVALAIKIDDPGPVFFRQKRVGLHKSHFQILKFRTMKMETPKDVPTHLLDNPQQYITRVGRILRKTSLDELPELLNILRGDMSIVGPRPLLVKYLPLYNEEQSHRHDVRPGLTGWAQVNGRNSVTWEEKFRLDLWYVRNLSFMVDAKIILLTVKSVLRRDGISSDTAATMEEFTGTKENLS